MKEENVTNEELARMVKEGFDHTATKKGLNNLKISMDNQFSEVNHRLDNQLT